VQTRASKQAFAFPENMVKDLGECIHRHKRNNNQSLCTCSSRRQDAVTRQILPHPALPLLKEQRRHLSLHSIADLKRGAEAAGDKCVQLEA